MKDVQGFNNFASKMNIDVPLLHAAVEVNRRMNSLAQEGLVPHATDEKPKEQDLPPVTNVEETFEKLKKIRA